MQLANRGVGTTDEVVRKGLALVEREMRERRL